MEDAIPLATEEDLSSIPKEQSPTLMIKGVLGNFVPEVETVEVREVEEEEEGSSSTWGDNKRGNADDEDQFETSREKLTELHSII